MNKRNVILSALILVLILVIISGCSSTSSISKKSTTPQDELFLFVSNKDTLDIGELYLKDSTNEKEKIASDVIAGSAFILEEKKTILYTDKDYNLYIKESGKEKEKLVSDVLPYSIVASKDESAVLFIRSEENSEYENELYIKREGKEKEKITSDVLLGNYYLSNDGKTVFFVDMENNLYIKKEGTDKEKVSSDVMYYHLSIDGKTIAFVNNDFNLYIKRMDEQDKQKITSESVYEIQISQDGKIVSYLNEYNYEKGRGELYVLKQGENPQKIASDVTSYQLSMDGNVIYYLNEEKNLYKQPLSKGDKEKIATEAVYFAISENGDKVVYSNKDSGLYIKEDNKEKEKIKTDVQHWHFIDNRVIFMNKEKDLFIKQLGKEAEKIASNIELYLVSPNGTYIAYYNDKYELFLKPNNKESQRVIEDLNQYTSAYFTNQLLFIKTVTFGDLTGIWKSNDEQGIYVEFMSDGKGKFYGEGETVELSNLKLKDETSISATLVSEDGNELYFEKVDETHITLDYATFEKISKETLDTELAEIQEKIAFQNKLDNAAIISDDILFTYQIIGTDKTNCRESYSKDGTLLGTLDAGAEVYIEDTYIDGNAEVWCKSSIYDYETYSYIDFWFEYKDLK